LVHSPVSCCEFEIERVAEIEVIFVLIGHSHVKNDVSLSGRWCASQRVAAELIASRH